MQTSVILRRLPAVRFNLVRAFATGTSPTTSPPTSAPGGSSASQSPPAQKSDPAKPDAQSATPGSHETSGTLWEGLGKPAPPRQKKEDKSGNFDETDPDVHDM